MGDGHSSFPGKGGFCFHVYLLVIDWVLFVMHLIRKIFTDRKTSLLVKGSTFKPFRDKNSLLVGRNLFSYNTCCDTGPRFCSFNRGAAFYIVPSYDKQGVLRILFYQDPRFIDPRLY